MQSITRKPRVGVFIDTQNLYHSARDLYERTVNFERLLQYATEGRELVRAVSYVVEREGEGTARPFIYKLSTIGYKVRRMTLQLHHTNEQGKAIWEGNWDMGIVADMTRLLDHLDVIVLGSGDGDFTDMVEVFQERGVRVEVIAFREHTAQKLVDACDRYTNWSDVDGAFMPPAKRKGNDSSE
ncbi:NYN domain-containing protein [Deinococcus maricopensis]|uniref:NYN domain-containing protein n=1 Tax=Deinococcus maricopensis (strain DSM 21211 / LMG 22137 / NRRL B-23946 / LB-34) TaxID=709986 RepID=E8U9H6_DEIML|nr:NYN domain-containing protein [Deinococcus maricopensis]ADV67715.1 Domain of unknown function DUF88 [Deinococcus maricopensis DSM 21211]